MTVNMAEFRQVVEKLGEMGDVVATLQRNTQDLYQEATVNKTQSTAAIDNLRREIIDKCNAGIDDAAAKIVDLQNKADFLNDQNQKLIQAVTAEFGKLDERQKAA